MEMIEKSVIQFAINNSEYNQNILNEQYKNSEILKRDFTGVGFFTYYHIYDSPSLKEKERIMLHTAAKIEGMELELLFILYIEEGYITCLEGVTIDEEFPGKLGELRLENIW